MKKLEKMVQMVPTGRVPNGYSVMGHPTPLLGENDSYWIAQAEHTLYGEGILIYEDGKVCVFLTGEEALTTLHFLRGWAKNALCEANLEQYANNMAG